MIQSVLIKLLYCSFILGMVFWYWVDAPESTKTGLFFFVFVLAFVQNAYYSHKLSQLKKQIHAKKT